MPYDEQLLALHNLDKEDHVFDDKDLTWNESQFDMGDFEAIVGPQKLSGS